jgi:hypothetical protein
MPYRTAVTALSEEAFRALLDSRGLLRDDGQRPFPFPERTSAFTVFAQRSDAALDLTAIKAHAARFFDAKLGLTVDKSYGPEAPQIDIARIVVQASSAGRLLSGTRLCFGRRADASDHVAAESAEQMQGTSGMSLLAQRCNAVWLVTLERDDDRVALTIAAVLASSLLGPILSPRGDELFGVRTARLKLEGQTSPYR